MATNREFARTNIGPNNPLFSNFKVMVESAFYGNNVERVTDLATAYANARRAPGVVTTDMPIAHTDELGLPADAKVLVSNDGRVVGRTAAARRIIGQPGIDAKYYADILREAVFAGTRRQFFTGDVVVGLDKEFSVRAHLLLNKDYAANFYSYLLNFQIATTTVLERYAHSNPLPENDIYIYADPDWAHPDFPNGLALFDPTHNVAAILGLRYFGELKKSTLTLAWATAHRNGFTACHGGMKRYDLGTRKFTMAAFGLSGSGKSTITLAKHDGKYKVDVLHDDAFVINRQTGTTTALEPAYFDKTADYAPSDPALQYFLTAQNVGVTLDDAGQKVLVTQEVRNNNGRAIKSRFLTPNRVDHLAEPLNAVFWIMKDDTLPAVLKITDPTLAAVFGATLATKRSTAENLVGKVDMNALVIEPFANPFRCYPLGEDYADFRSIFADGKTACYILNTGFFNGKKVTPGVTLGSIEKIVENQAAFTPFGDIQNVSYLDVPGYPVDFTDADYTARLRARMHDRLEYVKTQKTANAGYNALPDEAEDTLVRLLAEL
ncbi:phosphoenolpyruvate carboxykinase (ATP) [Lacticaseibacillus sharpeae]|uniref:phosphoenolpyruvate carboxykinase (ATP) n=1 Tax=Lacticaseibacillus sharpeae JCM 1186 = DSM 20505 TaxID=1291052 RepID=A0A0R1ZJW6_9LACO|nr:phosphoenolpyruvate carboxykinase (ATP) [Lacticaseibacillus sharpeae]KRM54650.1 phosphoenolpyruvate carboxykinase (ATP) [Lacticaseibacillus sharpeae JCM 1186 = DSM 20505]